MIQAVCESCSVRWTIVNRKVYKFQSLVFSEDGHENETSLSSSDNMCQNHSKVTAPIQWKQIYSEYLGQDYEVPQGLVGMKLPIIPQSDKVTNKNDVTSMKKDQRRVRFEDEIEHDDQKSEDEKQTQKIGCLPDCYLCRSINPRKTSPPYQALQNQLVLKTDL